jgi:hypothetical protein
MTRFDVAKHLRRVEAFPSGSNVGERDRLAEFGNVGNADRYAGLLPVEVRVELLSRHPGDLADRLPEQPERRAHDGHDKETCHEFHARRRGVVSAGPLSILGRRRRSSTRFSPVSIKSTYLGLIESSSMNLAEH